VKVSSVCLGIELACLLTCGLASAQIEETPTTGQTMAASNAIVPRLIRVTGALTEGSGKPSTGVVSTTFALYKEQNSPDPLWQETQNIRLDATGHYTVLLGATKEEGLALDVFASGEAHWLGIQPEGQTEQPRILLLSVAYALKASDADTLGGRPAAAYALAGPPSPLALLAAAMQESTGGTPALGPVPQATCTAITSDGAATVNQIAKFTTNCNLENSAIFENAGKVGIGTKTPAAALEVTGNVLIRGVLNPGGIEIEPQGEATAVNGFASKPVDLEAAVFNPNFGSATYFYRWQAEPVQNNLKTAGASLNLLFGVPGQASETGLSINSSGILSFARGQTFPSSGISSIATGAGLTGGPITTSGTISIPAGGVTNAMLANPSVTVKAGAGLSGGGTVGLGGTVTLSSAAAGTITGVTAGPGLTGGGTTGNVSLSLLQTCSTGQVLAWSGASWLCSTVTSSGGGIAGTGTTHGIAYFSNAATLTSTASPANGQILIGSTGKVPVLGTLTAGANVTITNAAGKITISSAGGAGQSAPALPFFITASGRTGTTIAAGTNVNALWGFLLPYNVTSTKITYDVLTADNTAHKYDIGLFDDSGRRVVNVGPTAGTLFAPSKGFKTMTWDQGSTSLAAGRYYLGFTTNCIATCASLAAAPAVVSFTIDRPAGASTGGALSNTIAPPADNWNTGIQPAVVIQ